MGGPASFDRFTGDYDRFVGLRLGEHVGWVLGLGLRGERALDVGCGSGHAVERLAERYDQVLGVDLSGPMIEIARRTRARANVEYRAADAFAIEERGFDLVYSHTMMHHLPDYRVGLEHQFRQVYDDVFPGAEYDDLGFALAMRWTCAG